ncbi:MAG: pitrilysin family protein [bacterium]
MSFRVRLAAAVSMAAFVVPAASAKSPSLEDLVHEYTLDNGLTLLVVENHDSPTIGTVTAFSVGGAEEKPGVHGITHVLEHLLFKGTEEIGTSNWEAERPHHERVEELTREILRERAKMRPDQAKIDAWLAERGAEEAAAKEFAVDNELMGLYAEAGGTFLNAFTSYDITAYVQAIPSNRLELWMYLESERLRNPVLRQFYTEVQNVQEERRLSVDGDPEGTLQERFLSAAFDHHGYGFSLIGYPSDIDAITRTEAEDWFRVYYAPNRMTIALVGDVDPEDVHRRVRDYFGGIPRQEPPTPLETHDPPLDGARRIEVEFDAEPQILMGWRKENAPSADDATLRVISEILTGGRSSRLNRALVDERQMVASIDTDHEFPGNRWDNLFVLSAEPRSPHTTGEVEDAVWRELDRLKREPVGARELEKAKNRIKAERVRELASNFWTAVQLASYQAAFGDWRVMTESDRAVERVTADDVRRVAAATFQPKGTVVATLVPKSFEPDPVKEAAGAATVARMVKALGGDRVAQLENARIRAAVTLTTPAGEMEAESRTLYALPDRMRNDLEITAFGMTQSQGGAGDRLWSSARGQVADLDADEARDFREGWERDVFLLAYPALEDLYVLQGLDSADGVESVEVRGPTGKPFRVDLDPKTALPIRMSWDGSNPMTGEPAKVVEEYSDYRAVAGVKRPYRTVTRIDGEPFADSIITEIQLNGDVSDSEFARPGDQG